jgi:hypothetical protein
MNKRIGITNFIIVVCTAVVVLINSSEAAGGSFYVATSGNDSNDGSLSAPWRTIQHAIDQVSPGDTIYVRSGTYQEFVTFHTSGSATGGYITLRNYAGETPVIDGTGLSVNGQVGLFYLQDIAYIKIIGFELRNLTTSDANDDPAGIWVFGASHHIEIRNTVIHDIQNTAVNGNAHGIVFYGNNATASINNIVIDGNEIRKCVLGWSETLALNGNVENFVVSNNIIHDNNNIGIDFVGYEDACKGCGELDRVRHGSCISNTVYNINSSTNPAYGGDMGADGIYVDGGTDIIIEKNRVYTCNIGIEVASEHQGRDSSYVTVRNNFVYNSDVTGISIGGYDANRGSTKYCQIVNNTLYHNDTTHSGSGEVCIQYDTQHNSMKNNIFYANSQNLFISNAYTANTGNEVDYNLYYSPGGANGSTWQWQNITYSSFSAWQAGTGNDPHSLFSTPQLVNPDSGNLHLNSNSPARDQGMNLGSVIQGNEDIDGDPRVINGAIDIGADEYAAPGAAALIVPFGTISTTTPTYTWNAVSSATWHYLWVNGPSGTVIKQWYTAAQAGCASGTGTCSATPAKTLIPGSHTWWIQTYNSAGYGPWSSGLSFTVTSTPPAATLIAPSGTSCDPTPTYIWNAVSNATWYYLWVNGPSGNVVKQWYTAAQAGCASGTGTCAVAPAMTLAAGNHTWWMQTYNSVGYGPWSTGKSFTVTSGGVPGAVTLIAPSGSSENPPPWYWWYEDSCATWYDLWVNGPSGNVIKKWYTSAQANCTGTWCWVTNATTLPVGTNTWWVQTWNSAGYGLWSSGKTFTISTAGRQATGAVVTVRKQGTGSGTILVGAQVCGPECTELTLPYTAGVRFMLQVLPAADSRFVGWQTEDGNIVESAIFYAQPGEAVIAVFEKK